MIFTKKALNLLNKLVAVHITKGVQPSDLADAIFENDYSSIEVKRKAGDIQVIVTFCDSEFGGVINKMKYIYDKDKYLQSIDQKIGSSRYKKQWDRSENINKLIRELTPLLERNNSLKDIEDFFQNIPKSEREALFSRLELVA
ncbi:hypothetical protein [Maridesulfovibrio sp.]|uniref:hypothetical protein n=1 Tax=Maridesulfovibrio sp. TaxID=2795000 RepID=UPI002A18A8AE|nr:hypothetical protein [Maridesulfovibrio sp.]